MSVFKKSIKSYALLAITLLMVANAWADDFSKRVESMFSPSVVKSISFSGGSGVVVFKIPERMPDYFESGDKTNKIFAIESTRLFRDIDNLKQLEFRVPSGEAMKVFSVSRSEVQSYYDVDFAEMKDDLDVWRNKFIQVYDTKQSRAAFVNHFATNR